MVKTSENGLNLAPFLVKCYEMVDDESCDEIICWSQSNNSFVIRDMTGFTRDLLPKYFKHQNFSSFMRQLNIYGFRKIDTDHWEFANEGFIKGQKNLLASIKRRKHPHAAANKKNNKQKPLSDVSTQQEQLTEVPYGVDYTNLRKEMEILEVDKNGLMQEFIRLKEHQESSQNTLLLLQERLQGMENNQEQLLSFLVMVMRNPGLLVRRFRHTENTFRKFTLDEDIESENDNVSDGLIVSYQPVSDDPPSPSRISTAELGKIGEHSLSFDRVNDILKNFDFTSSSVEEICLPTENPGSIILPKFDVSMLEQYLLSSPANWDNPEDAELDGEENVVGAEMEMGLDNCQTNSPLGFKEGGSSPTLEYLTEQLGFSSPAKKG